MKCSRTIIRRDVIKIQHLGVINEAVSFSQLILSARNEKHETEEHEMKKRIRNKEEGLI